VQATGCASISDAEKPAASFVLVDVQGNKIVTYSYILQTDGQDEVRFANSGLVFRVFLIDDPFLGG
jgi:hypothetical protein